MIYFIQSGDNGPIKIGYTDNNIENRLSGLQVSCPEKLTLLGCVDGDIYIEVALHKLFKTLRIRGEWFSSDPYLLKCIRDLSDPKTPINKILSPLVVTNKRNLLIYENGKLVGKQKVSGWTEQAIQKTVAALSLINRTTKPEGYIDFSKV